MSEYINGWLIAEFIEFNGELIIKRFENNWQQLFVMTRNRKVLNFVRKQTGANIQSINGKWYVQECANMPSNIAVYQGMYINAEGYPRHERE